MRSAAERLAQGGGRSSSARSVQACAPSVQACAPSGFRVLSMGLQHCRLLFSTFGPEFMMTSLAWLLLRFRTRNVQTGIEAPRRVCLSGERRPGLDAGRAARRAERGTRALWGLEDTGVWAPSRSWRLWGAGRGETERKPLCPGLLDNSGLVAGRGERWPGGEGLRMVRAGSSSRGLCCARTETCVRDRARAYAQRETGAPGGRGGREGRKAGQ